MIVHISSELETIPIAESGISLAVPRFSLLYTSQLESAEDTHRWYCNDEIRIAQSPFMHYSDHLATGEDKIVQGVITKKSGNHRGQPLGDQKVTGDRSHSHIDESLPRMPHSLEEDANSSASDVSPQKSLRTMQVYRDPMDGARDFLQTQSGENRGEVLNNPIHDTSVDEEAARPRKRFRKLLSSIKAGYRAKERYQSKNYTIGLTQVLCTIMEQEKDLQKAYTCRAAVVHCATDWSDLGWGCGYRNTQQILSSLSDENPVYHKKATGSSDILSIREIQLGIQAAWKNGIDEEGALQLHRKVVDSKKWIGTTEVYAFLTNLGYNVTIVQFSGSEHTTKLMSFCKRYFEDASASSTESHVVRTDRHPLYFQHQGHSRTIVGYIDYPSDSYLLVFDPAKRPSGEIKKLCTASTLTPSNASKGNPPSKWSSMLKSWKVDERSLRKKEYQLLRIDGILEPQGKAQKSVIRPLII